MKHNRHPTTTDNHDHNFFPRTARVHHAFMMTSTHICPVGRSRPVQTVCFKPEVHATAFMGKQGSTRKPKKQQLQQAAALVSFRPQGVALPSHAQPSHGRTLGNPAQPHRRMPNRHWGCQGRFGRHPNLGSSSLVPIPSGDQTVWSLSLLGIKPFGPCTYWGSNRLVPVPTGDQTVWSLSLPGSNRLVPVPTGEQKINNGQLAKHPVICQ